MKAPNLVKPGNKWFARGVVAAAIIEALADLDLQFPEVDTAKRKELTRAPKATRNGQDFASNDVAANQSTVK